MFSVIHTALHWRNEDARTESPSDTPRTEGGFSLIELLVVVAIIAILATIAIPIYIGVQNSARDSQVQTDLEVAKNLMVVAYAKDGSFPSTVTALQAAGFKPTAQTTDGYVVNWQMFNVSSTGFCIRAWADRPGAPKDLWVSSSSGVVGPIEVGNYSARPDGCPKTAV